MPVYEYECERCSLRFELKRSFSEDGEASCPRCQGRVRRLFSPVPIIFRGTGFYVTDSRGSQSCSADEGKVDKVDKGDKSDKGKTP